MQLLSTHDGNWCRADLADALCNHRYKESLYLDLILKNLQLANLIEARLDPNLGPIPRYWMTDAGRQMLFLK